MSVKKKHSPVLANKCVNLFRRLSQFGDGFECPGQHIRYLRFYSRHFNSVVFPQRLQVPAETFFCELSHWAEKPFSPESSFNGAVFGWSRRLWAQLMTWEK